MRKLLLLFVCMLVSIGAWATINVWPTKINSSTDNGYGIYDWDAAGDIADLLNGNYSGSVYLAGVKQEGADLTTLISNIKTAQAIKLGGSADAPKEPIGTSDLQALSNLTGVVYLRMDNCFPQNETVDFSQIAVGSSALLDVTLPVGLTKEQVIAAHKALKDSGASNLKMTAGIAGTTTSTSEEHFWFELNGNQFEYTGDDKAEGAVITLSNYDVEVPLTPAAGYPIISYTNSKNNGKTENATANDVIIGNKIVPEMVPVALTEVDNPSYSFNGTPYTLGYGVNANGVTTQEIWGWGGTPNPLPAGTQLDVEHNYSYTYKFRRTDWGANDEDTYSYTGTPLVDLVDGHKYALIPNLQSETHRYQFDITESKYKYNYTDLNGSTQEYPNEGVLSSPDDDMKYTLQYNGTVGPLTKTVETTYSVAVDGATVYLDAAGSLADADFMFTNDQNTAFKAAVNVYVMGNVNDSDVDKINEFFNDMVLLDLSDATIDATADTDQKIINAFKNQYNNMRAESALLIPTPPESSDLLSHQVDLAKFEQGGLKTVGYFTDETKRKMYIYTLGTDLDKIAPIVDNLYEGTGEDRVKVNTSITFTPNYNADGSPKLDGLYPNVSSDFLTNLAKLDVISVDMTWINISAAGKDFSHLSPYTHYIVLPQNADSYSAANDFTSSSYTYSDDIWVVSTYKGPASPYAKGAAFKGEYYDFSPSGFNQTGNLTWIRRAGTLEGAAPYISDLQKNADRMVIAGNVATSDLQAMNLVQSKWIDMSVADLVEVDSELASIQDFSNPNVEYLALPDCGVLDEFVPATIKTNCPSLKGLGLYKEVAKTGDAANDNTLYYASWAEGSARTIVEMLPEAQNATGANARVGMKKYKMWGPLNFADISNQNASIDAQGHYTTDAQSEVQNLYAFLGANSVGILSADLSMAWFPTQDDMCMSAAGAYERMTEVELPRTNMTIIPAHFIDNCQQVTHIAIPDIYTTIKERAFYLCTTLSQIDVLDVCAKDNNEKDLENVTYNSPVSPYSYKASQHHAIVKEVITNGPQTVTLPASLGSAEGEGIYTEAMQYAEYVTDVYVLATTAPRCAKDAFSSVSYYGNNTFGGLQSHPFARDKYRMSVNTTTPEDEPRWITMLHFPVECTTTERANYTDITREYSLADETGEVDGDGKPIMWPSQSEMNRSYYQAQAGAIWDAWDKTRDNINEIYFRIVTQPDPSSNPNFNTIYSGWHQFVLAANWLYIPEEEEGGETDYTKTDWYTFCIPFNMTKKEVVKLLGVPASTDKYTRTLNGSVVESDIMPEIRTLTGVTRYPSTKILLHISQDIAQKPNDINVGLREATYTAARAYGKDESGTVLTGEDNQIYIKGGYPYLIKAYVPTELIENLKNLGGLVLARGDFFLSNVGNKYNSTDGLLQAPYELKVQAFAKVGTNDAYPIDKDGNEDTQEAGANANAYIYTFVGQYWEQPLPLYSYYLGNSATGKNFFRATAAAPGSDKWSKWTWSPYVAVITANGTNTITEPQKSSSGAYTESLSMQFDANDDSFNKAGEAKFAFVFDDGIDEFNSEEVTAIERIDGVDVLPLNVKVYNINGQYVGSSVNGLAKGMYIINGKKYVVK